MNFMRTALRYRLARQNKRASRALITPAVSNLSQTSSAKPAEVRESKEDERDSNDAHKSHGQKCEKPLYRKPDNSNAAPSPKGDDPRHAV
jgi:hypothetical protein